MRAGEAKSNGVPHSWSLAHLAMRHASGSAAANACIVVWAVGHVFFIVISSRPVSHLYSHPHASGARSDHTSGSARFPSKLGPRPSIRSSGHRSQVASQRSDHPYAAPWSTRRARRALLEPARSLSRRALSPALSPPSRSSVSRCARSQPVAASSAEVRGRRRCRQRRRAHLALLLVAGEVPLGVLALEDRAAAARRAHRAARRPH